MDAYIYQANIYCADCAQAIAKDLIDSCYEITDDSETFPQGPYSNGGGEADTPQHCGDCGLFLENPLTVDGYQYVLEAMGNSKERSEIVEMWAKFYNIE